MRVVSWNCNGAFARKLPLLESLKPDLLVIQEASQRDVAATTANFTHWQGKRHRGLAVIGYADAEYRIDPSWDLGLTWFTPVHVDDLRLLAVWASVLTPTRRYVRLIHEAMPIYREFLASPRGILTGDLNSNTFFDRKHGRQTHTELVANLQELDYESIWHRQQGEEHGQETQPTFYLYRRAERKWQLDFAFLTSALLANASIEIGDPEFWLQHSDHLPLIVDF